MALVKCPECGNKISDQAASCPNCGMPMLLESAWESTKTTSGASQNDDLLHCPKCQSTNLYTGKKGFSGGKALAGAVVAGGIGILAGTIGSRDIEVTCLNCGHKFSPVKDLKKKQEAERRQKELETIDFEPSTASTVIMTIMLFCWAVAFVLLFISGVSFEWSLVLFCIGCACPLFARILSNPKP